MLKNKLSKFILKLSVSLFFVAWLILKINWGEVATHFQKISLQQIILYVAVLLVGMGISSYKWKILAEEKKFNYPLFGYFKLYLTGTFLNNFFPSFIGGDTYRAYQMGKTEKRYVSATAVVVMDRVTGLLGAMILSVFFAVLNWNVIMQHQVLFLITALAVVSITFFSALGFISRMPFWPSLAGFIPKKIKEVMKDFSDYQGTEALWNAIIWSLVYGIIGLGLVNYVLFWGMGISVGLLDYFTVIFLISIVSSIPVSINNIGIKEWAYVTFFGFFGVSASAVVTVALVSRIIQMLVSFSALPMYLKSKK